MHEEVTRRAPGPAHFVGSAIIALVFLFLVALTLPSLQSPSRQDTDPPSVRRQQVVIFLIDTSDAFDAHGDHVHSVVRRHCAACDVRQVNLHGDISIPSILQALQHVQEMQQGLPATTTTLINFSLGTYTADPVLHALIRQLTAAGVIIIASAGNDNQSTPFYPAAFDEVLGVCSSTRYRKSKASYSNFGPWVGLCAPGLHHVTRPLQHGGIASGTSFASPMVAGVLGQLLVEAPCASARVGVRALLRTADPIVGNRQQLGAGLLNARAAEHYLQTLYSCEPTGGVVQRLVRRFQRLGTSVAVTLGLMVYAVVSIFAGPFLFAFLLERWQSRTARRQQQAVLSIYTGSPDARRVRLLTLRARYQRTHKVRRRDQAEFFALLHALQLHGEPCWWCDRSAADPPSEILTAEAREMCTRCGLILDAAGSPLTAS
jgi:Subtilase family